MFFNMTTASEFISLVFGLGNVFLFLISLLRKNITIFSIVDHGKDVRRLNKGHFVSIPG